ncbi:MAG TPA: hypothetical protein VFU23_00130 [Gemmatimonadales bacterium]|nr:hypothetical protein [Gemmatimonadales bacterium]
MADKYENPDSNPDPLTGAPGAHPAGVGTGALGGAAAGAGLGAVVGGPAGALVGGTVGAVAGGLAGKQAAEAANPTVEDEYWRANFKTRPYVLVVDTYEEFQPAYRYGWESYEHSHGRSFEDVEAQLESEWESLPYASSLPWERARDATRDAWFRLERGDQ